MFVSNNTDQKVFQSEYAIKIKSCLALLIWNINTFVQNKLLLWKGLCHFPGEDQQANLFLS